MRNLRKSGDLKEIIRDGVDEKRRKSILSKNANDQ